MKKLAIYHLTTSLPLLVILPLYIYKIIGLAPFAIAVCLYAFVYRPIVDYKRLQEKGLVTKDEFIKSFENIKSEVVLVGCGIQKDYVSYLKYNNNKIAIDVGALLDAWSGLLTRPWFRKDGKQDYLVL